MACILIDLSTQDCVASDGGIYETQIVDASEITDVIFDGNGNITNFVMATAGAWRTYTMDDDDTAFYNQTGERTGNKHTSTQQAFMKFAGIDELKIQFANGIKDCCQLVAIHRSNTDKYFVQGIDYNSTTGDWKLTKRKLKALVNVFTDTGDNEDRVEITLDSTGKCFSQLTTLDSAAITAL